MLLENECHSPTAKGWRGYRGTHANGVGSYDNFHGGLYVVHLIAEMDRPAPLLKGSTNRRVLADRLDKFDPSSVIEPHELNIHLLGGVKHNWPCRLGPKGFRVRQCRFFDIRDNDADVIQLDIER